MPLSDRATRFARLIQASAERIHELTNNMLDFAHGRLDGGVPIVLNPETMGPVLMQVISELRASWPDRVIEAEFSLSTAVNCDRGRVGQLFSNLLANALTYGNADAPIRVCARTVVLRTSASTNARLSVDS